MVLLGKDLDDPRVVQSRGEGGKEVRQEVGLVGEVEGDGLIGNLHVGNLDSDLFELVVVPVSKAFHHGQSRVVGLV